jgi:hypothetical protein
LRQRIAAPGAPGCFPGFLFFSARSAARLSFQAGGSSALGGIEEFPEFLDGARRAASSFPRSSATSAVSASICPEGVRAWQGCPRE